MMSIGSRIYPFPLGAQMYQSDNKKGIRVSFPASGQECGVILFDRRTGKEKRRHIIPAENRMGDLCFDFIELDKPEKISYLFFDEEEQFPDKWGKAFASGIRYGKKKKETDLRAVFPAMNYDWENDRYPCLAYEDSIVYLLHVRGFTMHVSSAVKARGTFAGVQEKIPYLKELGITTLELQPVYEFTELPEETEKKRSATRQPVEERINYWGYQEGYYYAPKEAYACSKDAVTEFKDLVKALHREGMEVILQFYFPDKVRESEILDILHFWRFTYHVDGFHLMGSRIPAEDISRDGSLKGAKIWYYTFPEAADTLQGGERGPENCGRTLAEYRDEYMYHIRSLLKGDENMLYTVMQDMRRSPAGAGVINYVTNYYGFTMMDLVSYDRKHNEDNGENNRDGNDYNCSWNCGAEGPTKRKQVLNLREKQYRNAFSLLMLSQGTPLFFMGDEFGNTQKGNNNPYCQDNSVAWLNWNDRGKNEKLFLFVKQLISLRKENSVFHMRKECMLMDYKALGCPDLSYHSEEAWRPSWESYNRHIGVMLTGDYAPGCEGKFYYLALNLHWEKHSFALPKLPKTHRWELVFTTDVREPVLSEQNVLLTTPRSVALLCGQAVSPAEEK